MATETLNFTIGQNFGSIITDIAQEHLLYNRDIDKSFKAIKDSLIGIQDEDVLTIILGDKSLIVDVDTQEVVMIDVPYKRNFKIAQFVEEKLKYHKTICESFEPVFSGLLKSRKNKFYSISFNYNDLHNFFIDNDTTEIIKTLSEETKVGVDKQLHETLLSYAETIAKDIKYFAELKSKGFIQDFKVKHEILRFMDNINNLRKKATKSLPQPSDMLSRYLDAQKEIDKAVDSGIQPVNMNDGYSAGWLSPDGTYYGLNGEIANMLHNQIADALVEIGVIPKDLKDNPDIWLEQNGWIKQHGNWILFSGYDNHKFGKKDLSITDAQKKAVKDFVALNHNSIVKVGFRMENISGARFEMTDDVQFRTRYFKF